MEYPVISPPVGGKSFSKMSREEARTYFQWYLSQIPIRIRILERAVRTSGDKYRKWEADMSPVSLIPLGEWFAENIVVVPPSAKFTEEWYTALESLPPQYRNLPSFPKYVFSARTHSIVIDIGMYFGETLRKQMPYLKWQLCTTKFAYHTPVLTGFKRLKVYNPEEHVYGFARDLVESRCEPSRLKELFDTRVYYETEA